MVSMFQMKRMAMPAARWGGALGAIGFFLLYEDLPQLILQTQYGVWRGWTGVAEEFGLIEKKGE